MIPELPRTYVQHVVAPRDIGDVEDAHAAGEVGSMVGGLGVRMSVRYDAAANGDSRVQRAAGRAFGSAAPLAAISWLADAVQGLTWEEACGFDAATVLDGLCEGNGRVLPAAVERAADFAVQALRRALGVAVQGQPADPQGPGILVCRCIGVGDRVIRAAIRAGARDPEAVGEVTGACTGCRSCRPDLLALIDEETCAAPPPPDASLPPAARIALARVGPVLRGLGLPLVRASCDGRTVHLGLGTARPGAMISPLGALGVARQILRELVAADVEVALEAPSA